MYLRKKESTETTATIMASSLFTTIFLVLPLSSLLLFLLLRAKRSNHGGGGHLPPSPPRLPLIGNLHQVGPLLHRTLADRARTIGPLMLLHLGHARMLVVSSPDAARDVLREQDQACAGRPSSTPAEILLYGCRDLIFSPYGEYWRQLRKICSVHLLSSKRVHSYRLMREEEVAAMISRISTSAATAAEGGVDMTSVLYSYSNDVLCRAVSGKFEREGGRRNEMFTRLIEENSGLMTTIYFRDFFPWLGWVDRLVGSLDRLHKSKGRWDDMLEQVIKEHEDKQVIADADADADADDADAEKDFVDILISLKKRPEMNSLLNQSNIKALLVDMFGAGTETSYITLEWAMAELIRSITSMKKLKDEVRGKAGGGKDLLREEEVNQMPYLKAVIKEVLRLHPPAPLLIPREVMEDCVIQGYTIPKKTGILVNVWAIQRDPKCWDSPEEFRPERFMEEDSTVDFNGSCFRFFPFGAGRRICPGLHFAMASLEMALANLMYHFDWELPAGVTTEEVRMEEVDGIVVRREGKLHLVAKHWSSV